MPLVCPLCNCSGHAGSDDEGPFRFDCNALEVKLSPRSRERETCNAAADATFEALLAEVCSCWYVALAGLGRLRYAIRIIRKCFCAQWVCPGNHGMPRGFGLVAGYQLKDNTVDMMAARLGFPDFQFSGSLVGRTQ